MAILDIAGVANRTPAAAPAAASTRKKSDFWLNIGVTVKGEDGSDVFIGLPNGIPLDDMKPVEVKGNNQNMIDLNQTKNSLLEALQKFAAQMDPGSREDFPQLTVQLYRRAEPAQTGNASSNNLLAQMFGKFGADTE
ncbi:MAG: hypothetical protein ACOH2T_19160 [Pseudomonas sp.]